MTLSTVGELYDVAINDVGYILADNGETSQARYQRATQVLDPPRFASGSTPFTESVERYSFHQFLGGRAGAGQRFYEHPNSDPERFFASNLIDSFDDEFSHKLHMEPAQQASYGTWTVPTSFDWAVRGQFVITGTTRITYIPSNTNVNLTGMVGPLQSICFDGTNWYVPDSGSAKIAYGSVTTQAGTLTPPGIMIGLSHVADRLAGWYTTGGDWVWTTLDDTTGTEEVSGGRLRVQAGGGIDSVESSGYVFTGVGTITGSKIYAWPAGTSDAPFVALTFPNALLYGQMFSHLGVLYVQTRNFDLDTTQVWRLVVNGDGTLTPFLLSEEDEDTGGVWWHSTGRIVYRVTANKVYQIDPATGGWQQLYTTSDLGLGGSPEFKGMFSNFTYPAVLVEESGNAYVYWTSQYDHSGTITLSEIDKASVRDKRYDKVLLRFDPLPSSTSVSVDYSLDGGDSWVSPSGNSESTDGATSLEVTLGVTAQSMMFRVTLQGTGATPVLTGVESQVHAISDADTILQLPVRCADHIQMRNGQPDPNDGPGRGAQMVRDLEALSGTAVEVQDVDWSSGAGETFEVTGVVLVDRLSVLSSRDGRVRDSQVAVVQCRKTG